MESAAPPHQTTNEGESGVFECNICLEQAHEPVVTFCGHLFCWSCLWRVRFVGGDALALRVN